MPFLIVVSLSECSWVWNLRAESTLLRTFWTPSHWCFQQAFPLFYPNQSSCQEKEFHCFYLFLDFLAQMQFLKLFSDFFNILLILGKQGRYHRCEEISVTEEILKISKIIDSGFQENEFGSRPLLPRAHYTPFSLFYCCSIIFLPTSPIIP